LIHRLDSPRVSTYVLVHLVGKSLGHWGVPRTIRNSKLDSRSARAKLPARKGGYWVPLQRGFALGYRKGPKGGMWLARLKESTRRKEITLGAADDALDAEGGRTLDYAQAQAKAREWLAALDAAEKTDGGPYTVSACLDDYLADYRRRGGKAVRTTEISVDAFIRPELGELLIADLSARAIRNWHAELAAAPARLRTRRTANKQNRRPIDPHDSEAARRRRATANRVLTVLKAALNHAFREGRATSDEVWRRVKPFREADAPKVRYLDVTEVRRLVNSTDPVFRPLVQAALLTGCRYGEITAFRVADFDGVAGTVTVRAAKGGRARHVVLTDDGRVLFEHHILGKPGTGLVFAKPDGKPWGKSHQHRRLRDACRHANIEPAASFHVLRHTYATMLLRAGAPLPVIAANLGHADTRMTEKHYAHLAPGYVAQVIRATLPRLGILEPVNITTISERGATGS
jgi:integrase